MPNPDTHLPEITSAPKGLDIDVEASKAIHRKTGRTFYLATRLLPQRVREATYVLYAFFRVADEVVDDPGDRSPEAQREALGHIRSVALGGDAATDPVLEAFQALRANYPIDDREIHAFVDAMERDVDTDRYATHAELDSYLRGSSVAVAYMMLSIMDPDDLEAAKPHARALGEAFQLTNFLRDVREDVRQYDRIYIPGTTLAQYGISEEAIERCQFDPGVAAAIRSELERTEQLYRTGVQGIRYLPEDCRFPVLLAAVLYAEHHKLIRDRGFDVLSSRPSLPYRRRLWLVAKTWYHYQRLGDPVATFEHASAVPKIDEGETAQSAPTGPSDGSASTCQLASLAARTSAGLKSKLGRFT